jgi:peptide methionine sulfoxide reductase MsrA
MKKEDEWTPFKLGCVWKWEDVLRKIYTTFSTNFNGTSFCNKGDSIYCLHKNKKEETVRVTFKTKNNKYYIKIIPFAEFYIIFWESVDLFIKEIKNNSIVEMGMERPSRKTQTMEGKRI